MRSAAESTVKTIAFDPKSSIFLKRAAVSVMFPVSETWGWG